MSELGWKDAIIKVLSKAEEPMHYSDIAQAIAAGKLKTKVGATPAASIAATISVSPDFSATVSSLGSVNSLLCLCRCR